MTISVERRQVWSRIVGVERRAAPFNELQGHPLPDPTLLEDEEFLKARQEREEQKALLHPDHWDGLGPFG